MKGELYSGLTIKWNYHQRYVDISMPGYVKKALHKFQHNTPPKRPQSAPHPWTKPNYGAKVQYAQPEDKSPTLNAAETIRIQSIIGTFLFYARAIDCTMLVALNALAEQQSKPTEQTIQAINQLLDYAVTHPNATIRFHKSGMILHVHSDASYLSEPKARSRVGGFFFLGDTIPNIATATNPIRVNGALHVECRILKHVVASAAEAECGGLFHNRQTTIPLRTTLIELGHPQPPTPIRTDNSTAGGIVNSTVRQKQSKAMDMRFYWVKDRIESQHLHVYWRPGKENLGDYFTKHHPPSHHKRMRYIFLHKINSILEPFRHQRSMRGCINHSLIE